MTWIESHQSLGDHPKTARAAEALKISHPQVVGHLHYLWWWALEYAPDGNLKGYTAAQIAVAARWPKPQTSPPHPFIEALVNCGRTGQAGFLERDADGFLKIHDWDEFAGKLIDRRARNRQRMKGTRATHEPDTNSARAEHVQRTDDARVQLPTVPNLPNLPNPTGASEPSAAPRLLDASGSSSETDGIDPAFAKVIQGLAKFKIEARGTQVERLIACLDDGAKPEWFERAAKIAAAKPTTSVGYVVTIIENWIASGGPPAEPTGQAPAHPQPRFDIGLSITEIKAEARRKFAETGHD